tara:strand:- start:24821 stop:26158 length:1338 start_codon:yes stop_codon:yes gene_type:complete
VYKTNDTIVALATVPGKAALNVVRLSGNEFVLKLYKTITKKREFPKANFAHLCNVYNKAKIIDQAVCVFYKSPKSFTSEHMLEISTHGGKVIVQQIIGLLLDLGARQASPGEFTYRAFINQKIDLSQAEAINAAISSSNQISSFYHINSIRGGLSKKIKKTQKTIIEALTIIEHELDFNEEEIDFLGEQKITEILQSVYNNVDKVLDSSFFQEKDTNIRVAIVGVPNSGKSSLFNLIVGDNRAIVSKIKGTTRDTIEGIITYKNTDFTLVDTAGIRKTKDSLELLGIEKTIEEIKKASIVICVDDKDPKKIQTKIKKHLKNKECLLVLNKTDLFSSVPKTKGLGISCKTGSGKRGLLTLLSTSVQKNTNEYFKKYSLFLNKRQFLILKELLRGVEKALKEYKNNKDVVVLASNLRGLLSLFDDLLKPVDNQKIINNIFKGFCVGK